MTEPIDISQHTQALCQTLGLEPTFVAITITPTQAIVTAYVKNAHGQKHLIPTQESLPSHDEDDEMTGFSLQPATETHTFKVTT